MKKNSIKIITSLSIFVIASITIFFILNTPQISGTANINKNTNTQKNIQNQKIKLSNTRYWNYAYLISGNNLNNQAKTALSGFDRKMKTLSDGSVKITLKATSPNYNNQEYILKKGEKLYFIETALNDDPQFKEYNLGDDIAVRVNANGYILK